MKRPHMSIKVKLDACLILLGLDPNDVEWHHEPALELRKKWFLHPVHWKKAAKGGTVLWDSEGHPYITSPDANDPRFIRPMSKAGHKVQTFGTGKPREGDIKTIAHTRRLTKKESEFRQRLLAKTYIDTPYTTIKPGNPKIKSRGFPKRQRDKS